MNCGGRGVSMDIECRDALGPEEEAEWRAFLAAAGHAHPRQDPRFAAVNRAAGLVTLYATGRVAGRLAALGLVSVGEDGRGVAETLSGPVADDPETLAAFAGALAAHPALAGARALRITPYWLDADEDGDETGDATTLAARLDGAGWRLADPEPHRATGLVDLTPDPDAILAAFSKSARREVRRAERQGVTIRPAETPAEAALFFESLDRLAQVRGMRRIPEAEWRAGWPAIQADPEIGTILAAWKDDVFLGGLQLYRSHHTAHGRHFTTEPEALSSLSNLRLAPLIWFSGMVWAREQGCRVLDVEGWDPALQPGDRLYNVYKYKGEFGPREARRIGQRERVIAPVRHALATLPQKAKQAVKSHLPGLSRRLGR